ncbi:MAG: pilY2 [Herminiimonas sp.]|nr:pilY2 [Herminiimonas sp.]
MLVAFIAMGLISARHGRSANTEARAVEFPDAPLPALMSVGRNGSVGYALVTDGENDGLYESRVDIAQGSGAISRSPFGAEFSVAQDRSRSVIWSTPLVAEPPPPPRRGSAVINVVPAGPAMPDSAPLFVVHPGPLPKSDGDLRFAATYGARPDAVYVHTNAGSIQSFRADNGRRLFSYRPRVVPVPAQGGTPTTPTHWLGAALASMDVRIGGAWKTVLASGLGSSAQGVVAVDVSDPEGFTARNVLFEFTDADNKGMGYLSSAPQFARFRVVTKEGTARVADMVVVPGGYNAYAGTGHTDGSSVGRLFLLSLDKPPEEGWDSRANYFRLSAGDPVPEAANALGPPAMLAGPDGTITMAWAGDLQGNVWRFDFSAPLIWKEKPQAPTPSLMFVATDSDGLRQPITTRPTLAWAPNGILVLFGTGKYVEASDAVAAQDRGQSFYALLDDGGVPKHRSVARLTRSDLTPHIATLAANQPDASTVEIFGAADSANGWVLDFADSRRTGERSIADPVLTNGVLAFNTLIPGGSEGEAAATRTYLLDPLSGLPINGRAGRLATTWLSTPRILREESRPGEIDGFGGQEVDKVVSVFEPSAPPIVATPVSGPPTAGAPPLAPSNPARSTARIKARAGRLGWREISNWADLHDAQQP